MQTWCCRCGRHQIGVSIVALLVALTFGGHHSNVHDLNFAILNSTYQTLAHQGLALPGLPDFSVYIPDVKRSGYFVSLR